LDATLTEPEDKPNYYQVTIAAKSVARDQSLSNTRQLITKTAPVSSVPIFSLFDIGQANIGMHPISIATLIDKQTANQVLKMEKPTKLTIFAHIRKMS
jgi:hypothetical protein